jgi:phosphoglycolate phosphatase
MIAIFDWDGTLCDSIEHIVSAMRDAAVEVALEPPTAAEVRNIVGLGLPQALARLFPALDNGQRVALASAYSRHFSSPERGPARLFDGAMDTLQALRSRGIELAVATGKSRRGLNRVLAELGLADYFEATRCADETRSKPHPLMVHEIMGDRGKSVDEVVVIGDSEYDMAMAREAGVRSVAVSFGVHDNERLSAFEPLAIIDELPQLLDLPVWPVSPG